MGNLRLSPLQESSIYVLIFTLIVNFVFQGTEVYSRQPFGSSLNKRAFLAVAYSCFVHELKLSSTLYVKYYQIIHTNASPNTSLALAQSCTVSCSSSFVFLNRIYLT